jgi:hypothetical protein
VSPENIAIFKNPPQNKLAFWFRFLQVVQKDVSRGPFVGNNLRVRIVRAQRFILQIQSGAPCFTDSTPPSSKPNSWSLRFKIAPDRYREMAGWRFASIGKANFDNWLRLTLLTNQIYGFNLRTTESYICSQFPHGVLMPKGVGTNGLLCSHMRPMGLMSRVMSINASGSESADRGNSQQNIQKHSNRWVLFLGVTTLVAGIAGISCAFVWVETLGLTINLLLLWFFGTVAEATGLSMTFV